MELIERQVTSWRGLRTRVVDRYRLSWFDRHFRFSVPVAILLFIAAIAANSAASVYATDKASNYVTDIILSNTPVIDTDWLLVWGAAVFIGFIIVLLFIHPRRIPFTLHALSLFFFIRAFFVSLTHLGPYPIQATLDFQSKLILHVFGGGDFFFSGHTGAPFLLALVFWHEKHLRYFFLTLSVFFGGVVLLGHFHYTIDVLSAFFISYGIYHIALYFFPKERALFVGDELVSEIKQELASAE